jgi:bacteriocin-like protein
MEQKKKIRETKELSRKEMKSIYGGTQIIIYIDENGIFRVIYK